MQIIADAPEDKSGTKVTFLPDKTIFDDWIYDYDTLRTRLRETAFLTKGLKITLTDLRVDPPRRDISIMRAVSKSLLNT